MAKFVGAIVDAALAILQARTPAALAALTPPRDPFADYGRLFTGSVQNFPAVWVMPLRTTFDPDQQEMRHQAHEIKIICAVAAGEPDELAAAAAAYLAAIDAAIYASDPEDWAAALGPDGQVQRVFIRAHDYGPVFEGRGMLARFPEIDLIVEAEEM